MRDRGLSMSAFVARYAITADRLGEGAPTVSRPSVTRWLEREVVPPRPAYWPVLAEMLGCTPADIEADAIPEGPTGEVSEVEQLRREVAELRAQMNAVVVPERQTRTP